MANYTPKTNHLKPFHFKPGQRPRTRTDVFRQALAVCEQMGFDPIREAILRYRDKRTPNSSKDHCLKLITDRTLPSLKSIEVRGSIEGLQQTVINILSGDVPAPTIDGEVQSQIESDES